MSCVVAWRKQNSNCSVKWEYGRTWMQYYIMYVYIFIYLIFLLPSHCWQNVVDVAFNAQSPLTTWREHNLNTKKKYLQLKWMIAINKNKNKRRTSCVHTFPYWRMYSYKKKHTHKWIYCFVHYPYVQYKRTARHRCTLSQSNKWNCEKEWNFNGKSSLKFRSRRITF